MSTVTNPRGPLPARVYWVRRGVVLLVAFLLVFGLARLLGGGSDGSSGDNDTAQQAAGEATSTPTVTTATPSASGSVSASPPGTGKAKTLSPKPTPTQPAEPSGECAPEDVTIEPVVRKKFVGDEVRLRFALSTTEEACTFEFSNESVVIKITSGSDDIWSSQQCQTLPTASRVLREGDVSYVIILWNGRRSDEECSAATDYAKRGWYQATVATLGGEPASKRFEMTRAPREVITETADPKPNKNKTENGKPEADASQPTEGPRADRTQGADEPNG